VSNASSELPHIAKVDKSCRIVLPAALVQQAAWIVGDALQFGWLLMGDPGRCRLLSPAEVENDATLQSLRARIDAELGTAGTSMLEFRDEASLALALRLVQVRIAPPEPGRRLTLPKAIAAIMQIRPGESEVALWLVHGHIELWTVETMRSAITTPLTEIIF
jgi:hypothetical protein